MARLSDEEIKRRKEAGAAKRAERLEKRRTLELEDEKQRLLREKLPEADYYHQGLSKRIKAADKYLSDVINGRHKLNSDKIPEILELFNLPSTVDAALAYKMCRDEYRELVCRCWYFGTGEEAVLRRTAFEAWNKMLFRPEIEATGWVILNILNAGLVSAETYQVLKQHQQKYVESGIGVFIAITCERMVKNGGFMDVRTFTVNKWTPQQVAVLNDIVALFKNSRSDMRMLEEIAEDTAEE